MLIVRGVQQGCAGGALSWADGRKTGGIVTLLLSQQGHTHTDTFTHGTPTQETLEQRFVIVFHFGRGVFLEIRCVSLLLSSSESVRSAEISGSPLLRTALELSTSYL